MTSTTRCTPFRTKRHTCPFVPSRARTAFGIVCPATTFRLEASGRGNPQGNTVTKPGPLASVAVTFSTTALASAGIPALPPTWRASTVPGGALAHVAELAVHRGLGPGIEQAGRRRQGGEGLRGRERAGSIDDEVGVARGEEADVAVAVELRHHRIRNRLAGREVEAGRQRPRLAARVDRDEARTLGLGDRHVEDGRGGVGTETDPPPHLECEHAANGELSTATALAVSRREAACVEQAGGRVEWLVLVRIAEVAGHVGHEVGALQGVQADLATTELRHDGVRDGLARNVVEVGRCRSRCAARVDGDEAVGVRLRDRDVHDARGAAGTQACPATCTSMVWPAASLPCPAPRPSTVGPPRVPRRRAGVPSAL